jgi:hypothetical protein
MEDFYKLIKGWLEPLGYIETYSNDSYIPRREFHFIKNRLRVVCVRRVGDQPYCYFIIEMTELKEVLTLKSVKFAIQTPRLQEMEEYILNASKKITQS